MEFRHFLLILGSNFRPFRTRTYDGHFYFQHIDKLRQFIYAASTNDFTDWRNAIQAFSLILYPLVIVKSQILLYIINGKKAIYLTQLSHNETHEKEKEKEKEKATEAKSELREQKIVK